MAQAPFLVLLVLSAAQTQAQGPRELSPIPVPADRLQSLSLETSKMSALQAAIQNHDYAKAEDLLAKEAVRDSQSQRLLLLLADVLFLDGKQLNVVVVLKKAELLGALDERSRLLLALAYVSIGRKNLAISEFERLEEANPSSAVYPYWLSRLTYRKTDLQQALAYAQKAVRIDAAFAKAHDQLGLCYAGLGENEQAIEAYKRAIRLNQEQSLHWPWPAMNLGTLYLRLDRLAEAEGSLRNSIAIEPQFPLAHFRLGQVLEKQEHWDEASLELKEAARLDPTYPEPHYALARIYKRQKDMPAAEQELSLFEKLRSADKHKGITRPD